MPVAPSPHLQLSSSTQAEARQAPQAEPFLEKGKRPQWYQDSTKHQLWPDTTLGPPTPSCLNVLAFPMSQDTQSTGKGGVVTPIYKEGS